MCCEFRAPPIALLSAGVLNPELMCIGCLAYMRSGSSMFSARYLRFCICVMSGVLGMDIFCAVLE